MDRLGQSLDDIIASRPKTSRGGKGSRSGGRGGVKSVGGRGGNKQSSKTVFRSERKGVKVQTSSETVIRQPFVKKQVVARVGKAAAGSIFDRLGTGPSTKQSDGVSGTKVVFANLQPDIVSSDIAELCSNVGEVKQVDVILNKSGRSTGVAEVYFARRSDAITAIKKFHGLTLDGVPMKVTLAGQNGKSNPFNPLPLEEDTNKRAGFFGTALDDGDEDDDEGDGGFATGGSWRGGKGGRGQKGPRTTFAVNLGHDGHDDRGQAGGHRGGGRGGGSGGSRGGRGGSRGRGGGRQHKAKEAVSQSSLDDDMDSYMAARG